MTCTLKSNWNKIKNYYVHEINVLKFHTYIEIDALETDQNWNRIRTEMYTKINVFENHMKFKINSLKIEMSKEINVTKYEADIEEKLKLTFLIKPIMYKES